MTMRTISTPEGISASPAPKAKEGTGADWREVVERQVSALRFGSVLITVHEGRVVQVETSVRVRFDKAS